MSWYLISKHFIIMLAQRIKYKQYNPLRINSCIFFQSDVMTTSTIFQTAVCFISYKLNVEDGTRCRAEVYF